MNCMSPWMPWRSWASSLIAVARRFSSVSTAAPVWSAMVFNSFSLDISLSLFFPSFSLFLCVFSLSFFGVDNVVNIGIDHRLLLGSTIGSFADQPSALSPVTESTIEQTNTRLVGPAGTQKPHRNTQFTRTNTRRKMNSVLDGDERRGAYAPIS
jgi:hypothetical protein